MPRKYHGPEDSDLFPDEGLKVLVDASNVAYENRNLPNAKPSVENILKMRERLEELGFCPFVIADASLRHWVDEPHRLNHLEQSGQIHQAPADTQADYFLLSLAEHDYLPIVSNDFYRDRIDEFPLAVKELRVPFMIADGQVVIDQERLRRAVEVAHEHRNENQICQHREHHHHHHGGRSRIARKSVGGSV
ncbi:MAG TPA: hypothetical protein VKX96_15550 [Chloroflexota bacterium]|nr:hypothetical protein [Chloroflexota bacterium]